MEMKNIRLGLCCLNTELRDQKPQIFCSRTMIRRTYNVKKSKKLAKKLFRKSIVGHSLGLVKSKELIEAYKTKLLTYKSYYEAIYNYNLSWAELSKNIGKEIDPYLIK